MDFEALDAFLATNPGARAAYDFRQKEIVQDLVLKVKRYQNMAETDARNFRAKLDKALADVHELGLQLKVKDVTITTLRQVWLQMCVYKRKRAEQIMF